MRFHFNQRNIVLERVNVYIAGKDCLNTAPVRCSNARPACRKINCSVSSVHACWSIPTSENNDAAREREWETNIHKRWQLTIINFFETHETHLIITCSSRESNGPLRWPMRSEKSSTSPEFRRRSVWALHLSRKLRTQRRREIDLCGINFTLSGVRASRSRKICVRLLHTLGGWLAVYNWRWIDANVQQEKEKWSFDAHHWVEMGPNTIDSTSQRVHHRGASEKVDIMCARSK